MSREEEQAVAALRQKGSGRQMSPGRRIAYAVGKPIVRTLIGLLWSTYRVELVSGKEHIDAVIQRTESPCTLLLASRHIGLSDDASSGWVRRGFNAGIIISPSVDGEVPSSIARSWGVKVIRGSATRTGTLAMRDMHNVMKEGTSIITAADGPVGPAYFFKSGVIMTSRIGNAPMLPISCAANRAWYLKRWDDFMIPKPFAKIAVAVGEPHSVPAGVSKEGLELEREAMQNAVNELFELSKRAVTSPMEGKT